MKRCKKCGKILGIFKGYRHPILRRDTYLSGDFLDLVSVGFFKNNKSGKKYYTCIEKPLFHQFISYNNSFMREGGK
jgi:hypothetical protein